MTQQSLTRQLASAVKLETCCALFGLAWAVTTVTVGRQVQDARQSCSFPNLPKLPVTLCGPCQVLIVSLC